MEVSIDNRQNKVVCGEELEKLILDAIEMSLKKEGIDDHVEVSVSFVDNHEIQQLNKEYRNIDKPTDVLSFPLHENLENITPPICLGDIVISLEKAVEQSEEYNHSYNREVAFLTVHSMFHLMGYDHDTEENTKQMRHKEEEVLQALGILRV